MSKKINIILVVLGILVLFCFLYRTYAINSLGSVSNDDYVFSLTGDTSLEIPAGSKKTIYYRIKNNNNGTVQYGVGYSNNSNVIVKVYSDSDNPSTGTLAKSESKFIKLYIENTSTTSTNLSLMSVLGYENGGDLVVPTGYTLVSSTYYVPVNLATHITNLYTSSSKTTTEVNSITYNLASSVGLMNDRLGSSSVNADSGNIRYYGASPNNYIYFNCSDYSNQSSTTCELWRIIGVFNGKVKIMRNESIGGYSWDNKDTTTGAETDYGKNDWSDARLMRLLNSGYESESVGGSLYWNAGSGSCYSDKNNATTTCDFTSTGLKNNTTRNLISESTYSLLGHDDFEVYTDVMYNKERITGSVYTGRSTSWTGKVALPYESDYGYAADLSKCNQTLYNYYNSTCTSNNWMKKVITNNDSNLGWLLTLYSGNSYGVWLVGANSFEGLCYHAYNAWAVAPVLYLNAEQEVRKGNTGSSNDPYKLIV